MRIIVLIAWFLIGSVINALPQAQETWVRRFNGFTNAYGPDLVRGLAVDQTGNSYVVGSVTPSDTSQAGIAIIKYNPSGQSLWTNVYKLALEEATPVSIRLDSFGQPYVAGTSAGDFLLMKLNAQGQILWKTNFSATGNSLVTAVASEIDEEWNSYLTGYWNNPFGGPDYGITLKYDSGGHLLWTVEYHGPSEMTFRPVAIAIHGTNSVVVTGTLSHGFGGITQNIATVKYDANGIELWRVVYDGPGHSVDRPTSMAVDNVGSVYVSGSSAESTSNNTRYAYVTLKYDVSGALQWAKEYNVQGAGKSFATAIALGSDASVHVTGSSWEISEDFATLKYDADGNLLWLARFDGERMATDKATAIVVDDDGSVYVTGNSWTDGIQDYVTIKYDLGGTQSWIAFYDGPVHQSDDPVAIALDAYGNVYVTGNSKGSSFSTDWSDFATIKYAQPPQLSVPILLASGIIEVPVYCQYRGDYRVEVSDNLTNWNLFVTLSNSFGKIHFQDHLTPEVSPARYYRVVSP